MTDPLDLTRCMLLRAGDLAHIMLDMGLTVAVASGPTKNGMPCTVIYATGEAAETARAIGEQLVRRVDALKRAAADRAAQN